MKKYQFFAGAFLMMIQLLSCTKVVNLDLKNDTGKLVIEANITDDDGPQLIKLSRNVAFTATNSYPVVSGATVTVSDDKGNTYPFPEGPDGTYSGSFAGVSGTRYKMNVATGGVNYTASSTLPALVNLDSLTYKKNTFDINKDLREITVHFQDPPHIVNQYLFIMFVNGIQAHDIFAFNDEFSDGRYVDIDLVETDVDIHPGDTVMVEMQCIDKPMYTYWFSLAQQAFNGPGGVAPSNPPTNISPAALGYFSAHTLQTQIIVVK